MRKIILLAVALLPFAMSAKVTLPKFFTDSMVVQSKAVLTIPGTAKKNATVKITPSWGETVKVKADKAGKFKATLNTPGSGGPYSITFDDGQKTTLNDILSGEVWFCSGQSNMEMPVEGWGKVMNYREEVANANYPELRLLQVKKQTSYAPKEDTEVNMGGWRSATPETVANFSSIGYFFGRDLLQNIGVPVGIIDCTWGGTPVEAWTAYETLAGVNEFPEELKNIKESNFDESAMLAQYEKQVAEWNALVTPKNTPELDKITNWGDILVPGEWEKSVLPGFDGIVWLKRTFDVPAALAGKPAKLSLSSIDDEDVTYINGKEVGATNGYNLPRNYDIPAGVLKAGENTIAVKVIDTGGGGGIWGSPSDIALHCEGKTIPLDGAWQYSPIADFANFPPRPASPVSPSYPTVLYNAMMHPVTVMPVKGVLWYQGCANVGRAEQYSKVFKAMIESWRKEWNNPEMPFYFVQLAGYQAPSSFQPNSAWAALRDAQKDALELPNTGMAVAIDLGNPDDIHPKNKQEVARRLLLAALNNQYHKRLVWYAPFVTDFKVDGRNVTLTFGNDLQLLGGGQAFIVKGADGTWARGYGRQVAPDKIVVSSDDIANPVEIRYDWADYPDGDLRGLTGLPVAPFKLPLKK